MAVIVKAGAKDSDRASVQAGMRYISRADYVLLDEMARPISREDALTRYDFFRQGKDKKIAGYRVVVALPKTDTERGREIVQALMAERYHSFVQAVHPDAGNPHIHFHLAAYRYHPLSQFQSYRRELQPLGAEIERRCAAEGIKYAYAPGGVTAVKTQAEVHMVQRGIAPWKDDMRKAVKVALTGSRDFLSFQSALKSKGINITRETEKSLTFSDAAGRKARLGRLFAGMKSHQDVEARIAAKENAANPGLSQSRLFSLSQPPQHSQAGLNNT